MKPTRKQPPAAPTTLSATEFKATCLEVMDGVARGEGEVIVTKHGRPVVRVVPVAPPPSPLGAMAGSIVRHGDIVSPDTEAWEASATDPLARGHDPS